MVIDVETYERALELAGELSAAPVLQLAALRFADVALLPDGSEITVSEFAGAAILNLRRNGYGVIPLPADAQAFAAFQAMVIVARYAHGLSLTPFKPAAALRLSHGAAQNGAA
jgi:hypothetical protein